MCRWERLHEGRSNDPHCPHNRTNATFLMMHHHIYVFGGYSGNVEQRFMYNDLYRFSVAQRRWEKLDAEGTTPLRRGGHMSVVVHGMCEPMRGSKRACVYMCMCVTRSTTCGCVRAMCTSGLQYVCVCGLVDGWVHIQ